MVSLKEPSAGLALGPNVMVSACKSQNSALICVPLRCGPIVIPAPPPTARLGTFVAMPVHDAAFLGSPLYVGAIKIVELGDTTRAMLGFTPNSAYMLWLML